MLFMPQEKAKQLLKKHIEEGKERRRIAAEKRKAAYLKAKKEGRLDEYYEELREKRQFF